MRYFANVRAMGLACLMVAAGTLSSSASVAVPNSPPAASAADTVLAFNPQPDPPGMEDPFDHS